MQSILALLSGLAMAACGPEDTAEQDRAAADRMGPGMMEMMANMPEGIPASALPDPDSRGARLVVRYCSQCHGIPTPRRQSAEDWWPTLRRMLFRMERMERMERRRGMMEGMMRGRMPEVEAPTAGEAQAMLAYLRAHALRTVRPEALPEAPGAELFGRACSRCHALPDPAQHTPEEWPGVVARMRENMRRMDVEEITDAEARTIVRYLQGASAADAR